MRITRVQKPQRPGRIVLIACLIIGLNAPGTPMAAAQVAAPPSTRPASEPLSPPPLLIPGTVYTCGGANRAALVKEHLAAAASLEQAGRWAAAEARYAEALRLDPRNREIYSGLMKLYYLDRLKRDYERTLALVIHNYYLSREAATFWGKDDSYIGMTSREDKEGYGVPAPYIRAMQVEAFTFRGLSKFDMDDLRGALNDFDKASAIDPKSPRPHVARAEVFAAAYDVAAALTSYENAIRAAPDTPTPYFSRGLMHFKRGQPEAALKDLNRVVELLPESFDARLARGMTLAKLRRGDEALADFEVALRLEPSNDNVFAERALAHHVKGDLDQARADCAKAIDLNPDNARAYLHRGLVEHAQNRTAPGFADLAQAVRLSDDSAPAALAVAEAVIKAKPASPEAFHLRGLVRLRDAERLAGVAKARAMGEALSDLQRHFALGGIRPDAHYDLGLCLASLGRHEEALNAYKEAELAREPLGRRVNPYLASAYSLHALKRFNVAARYCDAAVSAEPQNAQVYKWRGLVRLSLPGGSARPPAFDDLKRANELGGRNDPEVWYLMGLAHLEAARAARNPDDRVAHLKDALERNGESSGAYTEDQPHHLQLRAQAEAQLYYAGAHGSRNARADKQFAKVKPWPAAVTPGQRPAPETAGQRDTGKNVEEDNTGLYILFGVGALMLANELLRDNDGQAAAGAAGGKRKTSGGGTQSGGYETCGSCRGAGQVSEWDHYRGQMYWRSCFSCGGSGTRAR